MKAFKWLSNYAKTGDFERHMWLCNVRKLHHVCRFLDRHCRYNFGLYSRCTASVVFSELHDQL